MRNVKNVVEKAKSVTEKINPYYDMSFENMREIYNTYGGNFEVICCSFRFGYLQGIKAAKAEMKKRGAING